jgi:glycosyltransferase involved in cell wall biosynthesis
MKAGMPGPLEPIGSNVTTTEMRLRPDQLDRIFVVIPVLNEEDSIGLVLSDLPRVHQTVVVDNGSTDSTASVASQSGAKVISEPRRGYGQACLKGIAEVNAEVTESGLAEADTIIVFVDGDYSDHPNELPSLVIPILDDESDFVIGSRSSGERESGAMPFQAVMGNWLACTLMKLFWGARFTDLGPFRAIRLSSLNELEMADTNFGWTIEMQIKAVQKRLRFTEVPVSYRKRIGVSKISGTISGTFKAGYKILYTIFRYRFGSKK